MLQIPFSKVENLATTGSRLFKPITGASHLLIGSVFIFQKFSDKALKIGLHLVYRYTLF